MTSPYLTATEAALYTKCQTVKAFNRWVERRGIPADARRGRIRLFTTTTLDRALRNDARPIRRVA